MMSLGDSKQWILLSSQRWKSQRRLTPTTLRNCFLYKQTHVAQPVLNLPPGSGIKLVHLSLAPERVVAQNLAAHGVHGRCKNTTLASRTASIRSERHTASGSPKKNKVGNVKSAERAGSLFLRSIVSPVCFRTSHPQHPTSGLGASEARLTIFQIRLWAR